MTSLCPARRRKAPDKVVQRRLRRPEGANAGSVKRSAGHHEREKRRPPFLASLPLRYVFLRALSYNLANDACQNLGGLQRTMHLEDAYDGDTLWLDRQRSGVRR